MRIALQVLCVVTLGLLEAAALGAARCGFLVPSRAVVVKRKSLEQSWKEGQRRV